MTEPNYLDGPDDRRAMPRYPSRAGARIIRETDPMRSGIQGHVTDVCVTGVGVRIQVKLELGEEVRVELSNPMQRFKKEVRGVVRHATESDDGTYQIGIELHTRFTPPEVQQLRSNRPNNPEDDAPQWI